MNVNENSASTKPSEQLLNPDSWVDKHGDFLYTYAFIRVRENGRAEDLVQDTFLAALKAYHQFQGRSSERTWLVGILKHKIIDFFRKNIKGNPISVASFHDATMEKASDLDGNWLAGASQWLSDPSKSLEQKEFINIFQQALVSLPHNLAKVFILHELDGLTGSEICDLLNISSSNLWVMLYRARLKLKGQLGHLWRGKSKVNRKKDNVKRPLTNRSLTYVTTKG